MKNRELIDTLKTVRGERNYFKHVHAFCIVFPMFCAMLVLALVHQFRPKKELVDSVSFVLPPTPPDYCATFIADWQKEYGEEYKTRLAAQSAWRSQVKKTQSCQAESDNKDQTIKLLQAQIPKKGRRWDEDDFDEVCSDDACGKKP